MSVIPGEECEALQGIRGRSHPQVLPYVHTVHKARPLHCLFALGDEQWDFAKVKRLRLYRNCLSRTVKQGPTRGAKGDSMKLFQPLVDKLPWATALVELVQGKAGGSNDGTQPEDSEGEQEEVNESGDS
jgi:hypothetical protein